MNFKKMQSAAFHTSCRGDVHVHLPSLCIGNHKKLETLTCKKKKKIINKLEYINYRQSFLKLTTKTRLKSVSI